jgi:hypothetical protein
LNFKQGNKNRLPFSAHEKIIVSDSGLIKNKMHFPKYLYMYVDYARFVHVWWPV